jgi:mannose-6-phosphate isomerase-like protein (cupin superfamily)
MGARPLKATDTAYSLFGCTMAPGFDYADYEPGYREELQTRYPDRAALIGELTREEFVKRPATATPPPPSVAGGSTVFSPESVAKIAIADGVELQELVGRVAKTKSADYSIARFALSPGRGTGTSYNKLGEEVFLVISGKGTVVLGKDASPVSAGSVVVMKPGLAHSLTAGAGETLEFYAITFPAFSPEDYVRVE